MAIETKTRGRRAESDDAILPGPGLLLHRLRMSEKFIAVADHPIPSQGSTSTKLPICNG